MPGKSGGHGWGSTPIPPQTPLDSPRSVSSTTSSFAPRASFGVASYANVGKGTENQDSFITSANPTGSKAFVGVFDGHGEKGGRLSQFARAALTKNLFSDEKLHSNPKAAIDSAYRATQEQIIKHQGQEHAGDSGTTAVAAYQHRKNLIVANVGDSRAVLGRCRTASSSASSDRRGKLVAVELSSDHKPCRPDEKRRITEQGGRVHQGLMPVQTDRGGLQFIPMGPERVIDRSGISGLAMSRALGDLNMHPYVTSRPELCQKRLDKKDKVVILGSDGVWDHVSSQEAVDIASRHTDANAAARDIASTARQRWIDDTQGYVADDITAVVMHLNHPKASRSDRDARRTQRERVSSSHSARQHNEDSKHRSHHRQHSTRGRMQSQQLDTVPEMSSTVPCIAAPRPKGPSGNNHLRPPAGIRS